MLFVNACVPHAHSLTCHPCVSQHPQSVKSEHASVCLWSDTQRMIAQSTWNSPIAGFLTISCVLSSCWSYTISMHLQIWFHLFSLECAHSSKSLDSIIMFIFMFFSFFFNVSKIKDIATLSDSLLQAVCQDSPQLPCLWCWRLFGDFLLQVLDK